ncbi:MAG: hypothetical protein JW839_08580 [Candidatus Lokiarchaeota archaeon]|nr:hypothetical protein [Candidatus Lokiarchaeota archaeon]
MPDLGTAGARLQRSAAPLTVKAIYQLMQGKFIAGRARWNDQANKDAIVFEIGIQKGKEGQPGKLRPGEIGYSFRLDSVVLQVGESTVDAVRIGEVKENLDMFKNLKNGMSVKLKLVK